jgi:molybdenum cofactor biosynthesis enzyme MoaA
MEKPFCYKPFNSIFVELEEESKPTILPCCCYEIDAPKAKFLDPLGKDASTLKDYFSSQRLHDLKNHFSTNNDFPDFGCQSCKFKEENGLTSYRNLYRINSDEHNFDPSIQYIEIFIDRQCNMACFMCRPESSTTLAHEYKTLGWLEKVPKGNASSIIPELWLLPDNIQLNIVGGEPFMSKHFNKVLEVAAAKKWTVSTLTNASLVNKKALSLLSQVGGVKFTVSVDGSGELYSLMRWPSNWQKFTENFDMLKDIVKQKHGLNHMVKDEPTALQRLHINYAVQVLNVCDLYNMIQWAKSHQAYIRLTAVLQTNPWTGWAILEQDERENLISWFKTVLEKDIFLYQKKEILGWINFLKTSKPNLIWREEFLNKIPKILKHRGIDITEATKNLFYADRLAQQLKERYDSL